MAPQLPIFAPKCPRINSRVRQWANCSGPFVGIVFALFGLAKFADADARPAIDPVVVGFEGIYRVGQWTPVHIGLHAGDSPIVGGECDVTAPDGEDVPVTYTSGVSAPIHLQPHEQVSTIRYAKFGETDSDLRVTWRAAGDVVADRTYAPSQVTDALSATRALIVSIGDSLQLQDWLAGIEQRPEERAVAVHVTDPRRLPDRWIGYGGVNLLVIGASRSDTLASVGEAQWDAIDRWIQLGGKAMICLGEQSPHLLQADAPLARWLPGRFVRLARLRRTVELERFVQADHPLLADPQSAARLTVAEIEQPSGSVVLWEGTGAERYPLIIRAPYGLGEVVWVTFDLNVPPLDRWPDRTRLGARLLQIPFGNVSDSELDRESRQAAHLGYEDLVGQLRVTLDRFAGVHILPFAWIATLAILYVSLIGPLDFWLMRRLGRWEWTWLTMGLVVVGFSILGYGLSVRAKGNAWRVHQLDLIDIDTKSGICRGTHWSHLFSADTRALDLRLEAVRSDLHAASPETLLTWQGLPGRGFGGMESRRIHPANVMPLSNLQSVQPYTIDTNSDAPHTAQLLGLPMSIWSTRSLFGQWYSQGTWAGDHSLSANQDGLLSGSIHNGTSLELSDCYLCYHRWAYPLGPFPPGRTIPLNDSRSPLDLGAYLTGRRVTEDGKDIATPWNREHTDLNRLAWMLMFHSASGGRSYTNLSHAYQGWIDLSAHLRLGRAILVGRSAQPGTQLQLADHVGHDPIGDRLAIESSTYFRIIFPVQASSL